VIQTNSPNRDDEIRAAFARSLKAIRLAFLSTYRLTEEETNEACDVLNGWFYRLHYRARSMHRSPPHSGVTFLLVASACQLGREFQLWKLHGQECQDHELKKTLARDSQQVALEILSKHFEDR